MVKDKEKNGKLQEKTNCVCKFKIKSIKKKEKVRKETIKK